MNEIFTRIINDPELLIATIALVTSVVSIFLGMMGLNMQKRHNKKTVLPIAVINLADYNDLVRIRISNNGAGPLIFKSFRTRKMNSPESGKNYPIEWMERVERFNEYRKGLENHAMLPSDSLTLLEYKIDPDNTTEVKELEAIRTNLKELTLQVLYKNVYGDQFKVERSFEWFGRTRR